MIDQRKRIFAVNSWILDLLLTTASFLLSYHIRNLFVLKGHPVMDVGVYLWILAIILPTWAVLLPVFRVYSEPSRPIVGQIAQLSKAIAFAWLVTAAMLSFIHNAGQNRAMLFLTLGINYVFLVSYRLAIFRFEKHGVLDIRRVAVVGSGERAGELAVRIQRSGEWGVRLVGMYDQVGIRPVLENGGVDEVLIVTDRESLNAYTETFLICEELGITARVMLNFFPHLNARVELIELEGFPLLSFSTTPTNEVVMLIRRVMDMIFALLLSPIWLPITGLTAVLIKLTSPGPVFFKQERCGLNGRLFTMFKLRSMVDDAEQLRFELESLNEMDGPVFKSSRDPRITVVGRFIRRFSIDEFPQFFNVLRGDMSLVGPRPPLPQEVSKYARWQKRRLSMKPGMTCLWQISGRNQVSFDEWMKLDLSYIDNWSLLLDLKILLKTVPVVLLGRGAK